MVRVFLLAVAPFFAASIAAAQTAVLYDRDGRPLSRPRTGGDTTTYYDRDARPLGTARTTGETTTLYDRDGRPLGTLRNENPAPPPAHTPGR
jgi:YD repeat-containing protein